MLNTQNIARLQNIARTNIRCFAPSALLQVLQIAPFEEFETVAKAASTAVSNGGTTPRRGVPQLKHKQRGFEAKQVNRVSASTAMEHAKNTALANVRFFTRVPV